ncbi:hypothetical protein [Kitasatospora sp. NPDC088134]|uniref:hypothetical protein n=1 Tax=Kitasatospora sp. NPDC088134 TaxID=3364071 RepID=UPI0038250136
MSTEAELRQELRRRAEAFVARTDRSTTSLTRMEMIIAVGLDGPEEFDDLSYALAMYNPGEPGYYDDAMLTAELKHALQLG